VRLDFRLLVLCLLLPAQASAVAISDALGHRVSLPQPARRIISLAPHATEMLYAAGAGRQVVAVVDYSDYPPAARELPHVGGYSRLDMEAILALKPDLVVAWSSGNPQEGLARLQQLGIPLYYTEPRHLEDISRDVQQLGRLSGHEAEAARAAEALRQKVQRLREKYSGRRPVRVFYQIWSAPLMTVNGEHLISEVIRLCGGVNIFAHQMGLAPTVGVEAVLAGRPDAIVASGMAAQRPEWLDDWRRWASLPAVRYNALYSIDPDLIQRQGPRIVEGAARMCRDLDETRKRMNEENEP